MHLQQKMKQVIVPLDTIHAVLYTEKSVILKLLDVMNSYQANSFPGFYEINSQERNQNCKSVEATGFFVFRFTPAKYLQGPYCKLFYAYNFKIK